MGRFNSSKTRVQPVFGRLLALDPSGCSWMPTLLAMPRGGASVNLKGCSHALLESRWCGHGGEKPLPPPLPLLRWLVQNLEQPLDPGVWSTSEATRQKRELLLCRDSECINEALRLLEKPRQRSAWHILEGPSYPDVHLETSDLIVVVEGKRTEGKTTTCTSWMPGRRQMWRHIDGAWEMRGRKRVYGLMIVEQDEEAVQFAAETLSQEAVRRSLPHRSPDERKAITECFLGATTWKAVCSATGVPWNEVGIL